MSNVHCCYFWLLIAIVPASLCNHNSPIWTIDLLNQYPGNTTSINSVIEQEKYIINVINIKPDISFFLIQLHSYIENVTLSYEDPIDIHSFVSGTNIGLVWTRNMRRKSLNSDTTKFYLFRRRPISEKIKVLLSISTYAKDDPIPGGCNMKFETMFAPYQKVAYNDNIIEVTSQPPSRNEEFCDKNNITTNMYYMYLNENDNDTQDYFLGIERMITVKNILKYGTKVPSGLGDKYKQIYNLYRGTGRVFAIIATLNGKSSAYVPAMSFGCNLRNWMEECVGPVDIEWKLICAFLLIMGAFVCLAGHTLFKAGLFTVGFTFGAIVSLLVVSIDDYFSHEVKAAYSIGIGFVCGYLWALLWMKFGKPLFSIQLTFLLSGILLASIILYNELGDLLFLTDDLVFWLIFSAIVWITIIPIFFYPSLYHIVALSLLGSYAFIVAMNYYVGGNLMYILINTYRRIAVKNFGMVVVDPPYQMLDLFQTFLWALLFGIGVHIQYKHSVGKAPFPPHRAAVLGNIINERTPLLPSEVVILPTAPETSTVSEGTPLIIPAVPPQYEVNMFRDRVRPPPYSP